MRILLTLLLSVIYFCSTLGFTVGEHYCMGKRAGISIIHARGHEEKCPRCGMVRKADNGCCKDVITSVKTAEHACSQLQFSISSVSTSVRKIFGGYKPFWLVIHPATSPLYKVFYSPYRLLERCAVFLKIRNIRR
ncbi:MAG: hypothetical protein EBZ77_14450 [Chitinophagia bacterium]|nr:hypothetical protein [Chitinophagia bacterium]